MTKSPVPPIEERNDTNLEKARVALLMAARWFTINNSEHPTEDYASMAKLIGEGYNALLAHTKQATPDMSLIQKLQALLTIDAEGKCRGEYDAGVTDAILVARNHQPAPSEEMVERVALAIGRVIARSEVQPIKGWARAAKAAIAAMQSFAGDDGSREAPSGNETPAIPSPAPANDSIWFKMGAALCKQNMGDASTRKDDKEGLYAHGVVSSDELIGDETSEISYDKGVTVLIDKPGLYEIKTSFVPESTGRTAVIQGVPTAIATTREPVSISLEKCAKAISGYPALWETWDEEQKHEYKQTVKAVLEAAGIPYAD